jgi:hypothetical protein
MLPKQVLQLMQAELLEYGSAKASVMEISHRGAIIQLFLNSRRMNIMQKILLIITLIASLNTNAAYVTKAGVTTNASRAFRIWQCQSIGHGNISSWCRFYESDT